MKHYEKFCQSQLASQNKKEELIKNLLRDGKNGIRKGDSLVANEKETLLTDGSEKF
jgi:hypothetical protein